MVELIRLMIYDDDQSFQLLLIIESFLCSGGPLPPVYVKLGNTFQTMQINERKRFTILHHFFHISFSFLFTSQAPSETMLLLHNVSFLVFAVIDETRCFTFYCSTAESHFYFKCLQCSLQHLLLHLHRVHDVCLTVLVDRSAQKLKFLQITSIVS